MIGAGAAGLTAATALHGAGASVLCLEARDRVGGRLCSTSEAGAALDLGAVERTRTAVLIDVSASMRRGDLWAKAKARALDAIASAKPEDQLAVLAFDASTRTLLDGLRDVTGTDYTDDDVDELLGHIGPAQGFVRATLQDTANPTMLQAGYKHNVIPQEASAAVDARFLPGHKDDLYATLKDLVGGAVDIEIEHEDIALDAPFDTPLVEAMKEALLEEDPDAVILPYCLSGGTDNKALSLLGITGYGFAPLQLPADLDFAPMFHGINERVPTAALEFGATVLHRFIQLSARD